ncbi:MAG: hypothetical protein ABJA50_10645 [Chloroflexota bacterium]
MMSSTIIATLIKMLESLPETQQEQAVEHLRKWVADLQDDLQGDATFEETQDKLVSAAQCARRETDEGEARSVAEMTFGVAGPRNKPVDLDRMRHMFEEDTDRNV